MYIFNGITIHYNMRGAKRGLNRMAIGRTAKRARKVGGSDRVAKQPTARAAAERGPTRCIVLVLGQLCSLGISVCGVLAHQLVDVYGPRVHRN